ncbi:MAG: rod shape-determining protein MreC [bacterium]
MLLSRRARELSLSVLLFAVPVVLLYGNLDRPSQLNPLDRTVLRVSSGLQRVIVGAVSTVEDVWDHYLWLRGLEERNEGLRQRNIEFRENNEIFKQWAKQGRRLERELGFTVTPPLRTYAARVVARGVSPYYQVLKIQIQNEKVRLRVGQAVAIPAGLVGRVRRVYGRFADVLLIDDVQSRVKVMVRRTGSRGELRGLGRGGRLRGRIEYLSPRDEVRPGDLLITSGMAGSYPRDLLVGRVTNVRTRVRGRYQVVDVVAAVSVPRKQTVYLVTTRPEKTRGRARTRKGTP